MNIIPITDKTELNSFQSNQPHAQFLQSWEWGEFQKSVGRKIWKLGLVAESTRLAGGQANDTKEHKLVDAVTVIKHNLPFGKSYLYLPRVVMSHEELVLRELEKVAKQENSIFLRIEPITESLVTQLPTYPVTKSCPVQPPTTLLLNLTKSEEELLSNMHPKTRYNIHLAERHGVTVKESNNVDEFLKLNRETTSRDKFRSHTDDYYRKMINILKHPSTQAFKPENCYAKIFTTYYKNQAIASDIVIFFGDTTTYLHGASSGEHRNVMAPHLLQWEQIKYAKKQGYKWYDFWGIMPKEQVNLVEHSNYNANYDSNFDANFKAEQYRGWEGITRFKRGFVSETTGKEVSYPPCFDLPISRFWYTLYRVMRFLRR